MTNNIDLIKKYLIFKPGHDIYYYVQIIRRKKDNPGMERPEAQIMVYYIRTEREVEKKLKEAIELAEYFNARVYINLNNCSEQKLHLELTSKLAERSKSKSFAGTTRLISSISLKENLLDKGVVPYQYWFVDLDENSDYALTTVVEHLKTVTEVYDVLPTKSGYHIIVKPFNPTKFESTKLKDIDCSLKQSALILGYSS